MASGTYKIPMETKDEDKWLKFFNKAQLAAIIVALGLDAAIIKVSQLMGITVVGVFFAIILLISTAIIVLFKIPDSSHAIGGGNNIGKILIRMMIHRKLHSRVYLKGYGNIELPKENGFDVALKRLSRGEN